MPSHPFTRPPFLRSAAALLGMFLATHAAAAGAGEKIIAAAKQAAANQLDDALPQMPLERWLTQLAGPQATVRWEARPCEDAGDSKGPQCALARVPVSGGGEAQVKVVVATPELGSQGQPEIWSVDLKRGEQYQDFGSLSELQTALKR